MPTKNTPTNSKVPLQISLCDNYLSLVGNNMALWVRSEAARKGDDTSTVWPGHGRRFQGLAKLLSLICTAWGKGNECSDLPMTIKWKKQLLLCDGWGDTFRSKSEGGNKTFNKTTREAQMTETKRLHLYSKARINISKWHSTVMFTQLSLVFPTPRIPSSVQTWRATRLRQKTHKLNSTKNASPG